MRKKVFVTRKIPESGIRRLKEKYHVDYPEKGGSGQKKLVQSLRDCHALVSLLSDTIDEDVLTPSPDLKIVANYAVGYNNKDRKKGETP